MSRSGSVDVSLDDLLEMSGAVRFMSRSSSVDVSLDDLLEMSGAFGSRDSRGRGT